MAKLSIKTNLNKIYIIGDFNNWDITKPIIAERVGRNQYIHINEMPIGEYRVFSAKSLQSSEIYCNTNKRRVFANRYFSGDIKHEYIRCYFKIGGK